MQDFVHQQYQLLAINQVKKSYRLQGMWTDDGHMTELCRSSLAIPSSPLQTLNPRLYTLTLGI